MKTRNGLALLVAGALVAIPCSLKALDGYNKVNDIRASNPQIFQSEPYIAERGESIKTFAYGIINGLALLSLGVGGYVVYNNYRRKVPQSTQIPDDDFMARPCYPDVFYQHPISPPSQTPPANMDYDKCFDIDPKDL